MYYVYGDLTPFYDRWGEKHTRLIGQSRWKFIAWLKANNHIIDNPHGSAFITTELIPENQEDLA